MKTKVTIICALAITFAGCGKSAEDAVTAATVPEAPTRETAGTVDNLTHTQNGTKQGSEIAKPPVPPELPFATGSGPATAEGLTVADEEGKTLDTISRLEIAVEYYQRALRTRAPESEEEEKSFKEVPPLTDLQQLVQYKIIKSVPAAPAGKKYIYDTKDGRVKLVNQ